MKNLNKKQSQKNLGIVSMFLNQIFRRFIDATTLTLIKLLVMSRSSSEPSHS